MARRILIIVALITLDLAALFTPVSAAGSVTVFAWTCPDSIDAGSLSVEQFASTCTVEATNSTFALTAR